MSHTIAVRPIHSKEDLETAFRRLDEIFDPEPGTPEADEAEVLTLLIQAYEREHFPIGPSDPAESILFHMDRLGLRQADLIPYLGTRSRVSEILSRKRSLTVEMIRRLHKGLGIPLDCLIGS